MAGTIQQLPAGHLAHTAHSLNLKSYKWQSVIQTPPLSVVISPITHPITTEL